MQSLYFIKGIIKKILTIVSLFFSLGTISHGSIVTSIEFKDFNQKGGILTGNLKINIKPNQSFKTLKISFTTRLGLITCSKTPQKAIQS